MVTTILVLGVIAWALFVGYCIGYSLGAEQARKIIRRFYK